MWNQDSSVIVPLPHLVKHAIWAASGHYGYGAGQQCMAKRLIADPDSYAQRSK